MRRVWGYGLTIIGGGVATMSALVGAVQIVGGIQRGYSLVMFAVALGCLGLSILVLLLGLQMIRDESRRFMTRTTEDRKPPPTFAPRA